MGLDWGRSEPLKKKTRLVNELGPSHRSWPAGRVQVWKNPARTRPVAIPNFIYLRVFCFVFVDNSITKYFVYENIPWCKV